MLALFIDGIQALVSMALLGLGAGASGATLGVAAPIAMPVGVGLGFVIDVCMSLTFGVGLLALLAYNHMFYFNYVASGGISEILPGVNNIPAWTLMTVLCIVRKESEEGNLGGIGAMAAKFAGSVTGIGAAASIGNASNAVRATPQQSQAPQIAAASQEQKQGERVAPQLKNIDGVRAPERQYAA